MTILLSLFIFLLVTGAAVVAGMRLYVRPKEAIERAMKGQPNVAEVLSKYQAARHPFASGAEG